MPRYLYLLRHAQSADKQAGQHDKDRQLSPTGFAESTAVGNFLKEKSLIPDLIISSSAVRAKATSEIISTILAHSSIKVMVREEVYETTVSKLLVIITELEDDISKVLLVGHNPILTFLLDYLTHEQNRSLLPGELIILKFDISRWKEVNHSQGVLTERFHKKI